MAGKLDLSWEVWILTGFFFIGILTGLGCWKTNILVAGFILQQQFVGFWDSYSFFLRKNARKILRNIGLPIV